MASASMVSVAEQEAVADLVRAIRKAFGSTDGVGGLEAFHVHNIHDFVRRLREQGVMAQEMPRR